MDGSLDVVDVVGRFGPYHVVIIGVAVLRAIPIAWSYMMSPLMAPDVPHWCAPPPNMNISAEQWFTYGIPNQNCSMFRIEDFANGTFHPADSSAVRIPCEFGYEYDLSEFGPTATSDWNLVCTDTWMRSGLQSTIMAGSTVGGLLIGRLSDSFGRKRMFYNATVMGLISGLAAVLAPSLLVFNVCRFFTAAAAGGMTAGLVTLFMELMPNTDRVLVNVGFGVGYVVPIIFIGLISWLLKNFRWMQLALGMSFVLILPFYPLVQESAKWQLAKGKTNDAWKSIKYILKFNKRPIPQKDVTITRLNQHLKKASAATETLTFWQLFKSSEVLPILISMIFLWFCESITYYHVMLNAHKFPGNTHLNYALSSASELPAALSGIWICRKYGRRVSQMVPLVSGMVLFTGCFFLPADAAMTKMMLIALIRFFLKFQNFTQWMAIHEIFATPLRSTGFAICFMFSRIGGTVAPFLVDLGTATHPSVPHALFYMAGIIECICLWKIPETLNKPLPDSLHDMEVLIREDR